ncbi:MAG: hypothetical protein QM541_03110 [Flavobacterium sp.]|nr:hypothetical protein [Flavobacterium sp.]
MKVLSLLVFTVIISLNLSAQNDTLYQFYNNKGIVCSKDSAYIVTKVFVIENFWQRTRTKISDSNIFTRESFLDKNCKIKQGYSYQYSDEGKMISSFYYENNKILNGKYFYPNGRINGEALYDTTGIITFQRGYDSTGNVLQSYIFMRDAEIIGGQAAWIKYLQNNLDPDIPAKRNAPKGSYRVVLTFIVDNDGNISDITANDPGYGTKEEAMRVIKKGPKWIPAIENGRNVTSRKRQAISFNVSN